MAALGISVLIRSLVLCVSIHMCVSVCLSVCLCAEEKQSRMGKNPKRVGANFRQEVATETSDDWLPSFGQVWSFGPRSQSR